MLGILKSNKSYVPIDEKMPEERKKYIYEQCENSLLGYETIKEIINCIDLNVGNLNVDNLKNEISMENSAYVIYTSGSTGKPKGVEITYDNMINTFISMNNKFNINSEDIIINLAPFDFDLSVYDIFNTLMLGAKLVIIEDSRNTPHILEIIMSKKVTVWNSVPMVMEMTVLFLQFKRDMESFCSLKTILLSGDKTYVSTAQKIQQYFPNANIISLGGATECAIWSNYFEYSKLATNEEIIPYGYALDNQELVVLNDKQEKCEVGEKGEIYIGGKGVAKGYFRDKRKTIQSFLDLREIGRCYKTGDLGIITEHGYINFLGRIDRQKKIRGYRIELDEIENVISSLIDTRCAVGTINNNIIAKVVEYPTLNIESLRSNMAKYLSEYMMPTEIIKVKNIDLTKNGKIDYKKIFSD
ncbi:AMP-binding protein [Clostridium sp.]|uniref:AMP-binding protein n=1 Tax=Clostridium sp. TaxID=1506 RepID=UPI003D6CD45F